jgi:hypothetical protein
MANYNPHNSDGRLAPAWLPRHQRRRVDREMRKLIGLGVCSVCNSRLRHNSRTVSGFDALGKVVVAGECCNGRVVKPFGFGLYSDRLYDFLPQPKPHGGVHLPPEQVLDAIAVTQKAIAETDKQIDDIERRSGVVSPLGVTLLDHPWKNDDRDWFERNPTRSHRMRLPFPGEADEEVAKTPAGYALIVVVRQVEPGSRVSVAFYADLLPVPDPERSSKDEAAAHALFEIAIGSEARPSNPQAFDALVKKYTGARNA